MGLKGRCELPIQRVLRQPKKNVNTCDKEDNYMSPVHEVHVRYLRYNKKCDVLRIA